MVSVTKIHVTYEIYNPPLVVEPFSVLEGKVFVTNNGEKDIKLKELFIDLVEEWDEETQVYPFKINLGKWRVKKKKRYANWSIQLHFNQKTKLVASRGSNKTNATCILPVAGTMLSPSFGNPPMGKQKKRW